MGFLRFHEVRSAEPHSLLVKSAEWVYEKTKAREYRLQEAINNAGEAKKLLNQSMPQQIRCKADEVGATVSLLGIFLNNPFHDTLTLVNEFSACRV